MFMNTRTSIACVFLFVVCDRVHSDENQQRAFFEQKIRPVLIEHCYECHSRQAEQLKGGLLLDSQAGWQAGGDSGEAVIVAGDPNSSLLMQSVRHLDGWEMPPDKKLPPEIVADLAAWIASGAYDPRSDDAIEVRRADKSWWSLQPLQKFEPQAQPAATVIDQFIAAGLAPYDLELNPAASPRSLIRRMSYDLIGLPPTPEDVDAFVAAYAQNASQAVEELADRLLSSPHYGEHWGRHWLDVVRFGESIGFERNVIIDDLWPFRDYVIQSINDDKPFDQFIREHLAGDVIGPGDPQTEIGSAFLVAGPYDDVGNQDVVAQANIRAATLDEIITATSGAFLGLTINCARCHHHKFDPIPAEDYFRLRATFEGIQHGRRVVASEADKRSHATQVAPLQARQSQLTAEREAVVKAIEDRAETRYLELADAGSFSRPKVDPQRTEERFAPVRARQVRFTVRALTSDPHLFDSLLGRQASRGGGRLTEFEVWTADEQSRNVALSSAGGVAEGARSAVAEDFPQAYGPQFTIDGKFGEQWFIGDPAELTISLAQVETIDRIAFSNAKGENIQDKAQGATPCEYDIHVSLDGENWQLVADSRDRKPWTAAHGQSRFVNEVATTAERQQLHDLDRQLADVAKKLRNIPPLPQVWVGNHEQPNEATRLHIGGDPMKPGDVVTPSSLEVLEPVVPGYQLLEDAPEHQRRLSLAQWITRDDNPLTARVLANRVWQYHFGTGIVDTPSDFGFLGGRPTHPELLDWLATRLIAHNWQLKPLHREILLSRTYQQSAAFRERAAAIDGESRLLWRFPPRRLSAEEIRDSMLLVAGKLNGYIPPMASTEKGHAPTALANGPGFRLYKFTQNNVCTYFPLDEHGPETYRRSVYHQNARASVVDVLSDFDFPDIAFAAPVRATTTTPLQALTLLNHQFSLDMAAALADRARQQAASTAPADVATSVYRLLLQRLPSPQEQSAATALIEQHGAEVFCRAALNLNEAIYVE